MVNGQVRQPWPEKCRFPRGFGLSGMRVLVMPSNKPPRAAEVLLEGKGSLEWRVTEGR